MKQGKLIALLMLLQGACAVFFVFDILATLLGLRATPISWQTRELLEIGAAIGLVSGCYSGLDRAAALAQSVTPCGRKPAHCAPRVQGPSGTAHLCLGG